MAGQDPSSLSGIMKDVWPAERLEKQFYDDNPVLSKLERTNRYTIGNQVNVPMLTSHTAAITTTSSAGGNLNAADKETVDKSYYNLSYNWIPVQIETGTLNQADGGAHSAAAGLDLAVTGAVAAMRRAITRQFVSNGDALIAKCVSSSSGQAVVGLDTTAYGFDAIERGWLRPRLQVDIGTTASETAIVDGGTILSVSEDETTPTITLTSNLGGSVTSSHYVSVKDARSGATAYETNGLRNIYGSATTTVGNVNPATAGNEYWKPAYVDTTSTTLTLDVLLKLQRKVFQKTGSYPTYFLTSPVQQANYYSLLQNQTRFQGSMQLGAGNVDNTGWNGNDVNGMPDIPNKELYLITPSDMLLVTGKYTGPTWATDIMGGANTGLQYVPLTTHFGDSLFYALNLAIKRRLGGAAAVGLTA